MPTFDTVLYDMPAQHVARITQNRPEQRNAQDIQLTYDLNAAFDHAAQDDDVKVIILAGSDPHFSAGHDLRGGSGKTHNDFPVVGTWGGFGLPGQEGMMANEEEVYLGMCRRWRNIPKPTIAQVQGKCIAGGLMLAWVCDLIVASEDAAFQDPVVGFGVCGVEYFAHPWELGARKAKEMLFTSDWISAQEAHRLGMVNHVVPRDQLGEFTLEVAKKIATKPSFALKLTKEAVNQSLEAQGQWTAMLSVFNLHQLCHSHNTQRFGMAIDPSGAPQFGSRARG
ncbi:MAG: enoyl-CoA hydratase [Chloroflexi bacterium]|nr:enoyl-CoA hydratase [Chloroflexota bacterium]